MSAALAPGTRFGGYRVVRLLGEGGMGAVHEAVHDGLQKRVAIKTLHPSVVTNPEAVERFVREGRAASKIRHPNVVDVTDVGVEDGTPYLVMEYLDGLSLASFIERNGPMPLDVLLDVALPIIDALAAAHDEGVVHRDLKPDNVFLVRTRSGELHPKLLDFGISKVDGAADARLTKTSAMMGTPYYMSPEQARGAKNVDPRSDQFSFGLVLHEMATSKRPIQGDSLLEVIHKISTVEIPSLAALRPDLPPAFVAVVERALLVDVQRRHASMRELGAALLPFAGPRAQAVWHKSFAGVSATPVMTLRGKSGLGGPEPTGPATPYGATVATPFASSVATAAPGQTAPRSGNRGAFIALGVGLVGLAMLVGAGALLVFIISAATGGGSTPTVVTGPGLNLASPVPPIPVIPQPVPVAPTPPPSLPAPSEPEPVAVQLHHRAPTSPTPEHESHHGGGIDGLVHQVGELPGQIVGNHPGPATALPSTPARGDVAHAMQSVEAGVAACSNGVHGIVRVTVVVAGATGRISAITLPAQFEGTPLGMCIGGAVHNAHFPRFSSATFTTTYPYRI